MEEKITILENIKNIKTISARNSMGCSENWYNAYYALRETFTIEELSKMSEEELNNLLKLADNMSEAFY